MNGNRKGVPLARILCFALVILTLLFGLITDKSAAAPGLFIFRGDTLANTSLMIYPEGSDSTGSEQIRLSCSGLIYQSADILVYDKSTDGCSLYDDGQGRYQPPLDAAVLSETGLQSTATVQKVLDNSMLVFFDTSSQLSWCVPRAAGSTCSTIMDSTPPVITVPSSASVNTESLDGAFVYYSVTASDTIDPNPVVTCTPQSGSLFPVGNTLVSCTATDKGGNTASGSFYVKVTLVDVTPPKADISAPKTAAINQPFTLDGSLSTDRTPGTIARYIWTNLNKPGITGFLFDKPVETTTPFFVVPVTIGNTLAPGLNLFSLTVVDAAGNSSLPVQVAVDILPITVNPGDCDSSGTVSIAEVQAAINMYLGLMKPLLCVDTDRDDAVSIAEVQKVINGYLGL
jgi:hypothetical protein